MQDFKKLLAWRKAHRLTLDVYRAFDQVRSRMPGLRSQILRAAASIAANIAEGSGKRTAAEFHRYLEIAMGSAKELEYHLLLARDLGLIEHATHRDLERQVDEVRRMLHALARSVRAPGNTVGSGERSAVSRESVN